MIDLERSLSELAERLEIPGGDWLVDDVVRRIGEPARRRPTHRRTLVPAVAVVALVALLIVAVPGARHAVARWLGFDSVRIEPGVTVPTTAASTSQPGATDTVVASSVVEPDLGLGPSVSMAEAIADTGLPDPTPPLLGEPLSVHVVQPPDSGQIVVVYGPSDLLPQSSVTGVGALVSVIPAQLGEGQFAKTLGSTSTVTAVEVDGADGFWIEGEPHQLFFESNGQILPDTLRLATNTLLWQRDGIVYRLEADIPLATAVRIATGI